MSNFCYLKSYSINKMSKNTFYSCIKTAVYSPLAVVGFIFTFLLEQHVLLFDKKGLQNYLKYDEVSQWGYSCPMNCLVYTEL